MSDNNPLNITLIVNPDEDDEDYRDGLARELRRECEELDGVIEAELARGGEAPDGARAGELIEIGKVAIEALPGVLAPLIVAVQAWMLRDKGRTTRIKVGDTELEIPVKMSRPGGTGVHRAPEKRCRDMMVPSDRSIS